MLSFSNHEKIGSKFIRDRFKLVSNVKKTWNQWLGPLVPKLPDCEVLLDEVREKITVILDGKL